MRWCATWTATAAVSSIRPRSSKGLRDDCLTAPGEVWSPGVGPYIQITPQITPRRFTSCAKREAVLMHVGPSNDTDVHKLAIAERPIMRVGAQRPSTDSPVESPRAGFGPEVSAQRACERSSERGRGAGVKTLDPEKPPTQTCSQFHEPH